MSNYLASVTALHSATLFYAVCELDGRLGDLLWPMLDLGGPLDAVENISAGGMTSWRQFPEQIIAQREAA